MSGAAVNGPVTIREVYAIATEIKQSIKEVDDKIDSFHQQCGKRYGGLNTRVSLLEQASGQKKERGGLVVLGIISAISAVIGAVTAAVCGIIM